MDADLRTALNRLLDLVHCLRSMDGNSTANLIGRLDLPARHHAALQAFEPEEVGGYLLMCPEGDVPAGSNVFLEVLDRSARVQRGESYLTPVDWPVIMVRAHRNIEAAQKRREAKANEQRDVTDDFVPAITLWRDKFPTYKTFVSWLKRSPQIRTRKPSLQRLEVSASDWAKHWAAKDKRAFDALDVPSDAVDAAVEASQRQENTRAAWIDDSRQRRAVVKSLPSNGKKTRGK